MIIGADKNLENACGGKFESFLVGNRQIGSYSYTPIGASSPVTVDEVARIFHRMDAPTISAESGSFVDEHEYLMTNGGNFFLPLGYENPINLKGLGAYRVTFTDGTEQLYGEQCLVPMKDGATFSPSALVEGSIISDGRIVKTSVFEHRYYSRPTHEWDYAHSQERIYNADSDEAVSLGLSFEVYQEPGASRRSYAYFDNAQFLTSNILWEFSADGGESWYCMYDLPNRPYVRMTLPVATNKIRLRATSNSDEEWFKTYSIEPHVTYRDYANGDFTVSMVSETSWSSTGNRNGVIFSVPLKDGSTLKTRLLKFDGLVPESETVDVTSDISATDAWGNSATLVSSITQFSSVSISGNLESGATLSAVVANAPKSATLSYQWYVSADSSPGTAITGATGQTYVVSADYSGDYVYVAVTDTSGVHTGEIVSGKVLISVGAQLDFYNNVSNYL